MIYAFVLFMQKEVGTGPTRLMAMAYIFLSFLRCRCGLDHFSFSFCLFLSVFALFVFYGGNCSAEIDLRILIGGAYCTIWVTPQVDDQVSLTILYCGGIILSLHANDVSVVRISGEYLLIIPMQKGCSDNGAGNEN
jgi:hypothetical protein